MTDRNYDIDLNNSNTKLTQVTMLMYLLMALGFVTGGLTTIAAIVIYYIKREEVSAGAAVTRLVNGSLPPRRPRYTHMVFAAAVGSVGRPFSSPYEVVGELA